MKRGEGEFHLSLHAGDVCHLASRRALGQILEQRSLADSGLPAQHQDPAPSRPRTGEQPAHCLLFASATEQAAPLVRMRLDSRIALPEGPSVRPGE